jgi:hypothetical protein
MTCDLAYFRVARFRKVDLNAVQEGDIETAKVEIARALRPGKKL